jgi:hypothetical protein
MTPWSLLSSWAFTAACRVSAVIIATRRPQFVPRTEPRKAAGTHRAPAPRAPYSAVRTSYQKPSGRDLALRAARSSSTAARAMSAVGRVRRRTTISWPTRATVTDPAAPPRRGGTT